MCGITGLAYKDRSRSCSPAQLQAMTNAIQHRGPDEEGLYLHNSSLHVGLGHRRLSVIDLKDGQQPLVSDDGNHVIVYNGEIYNHEELRRELEAQGFTFRTRCDTEVILQLYRHHGPDCVTRLRGMFSFAIWDTQSQTLFAARDRMGQKPFLYADLPHCFVFGSEAKSLLASGEVPAEVDKQALHYYFSYASIPAPMTGFRKIRKLLPGHTLLLQDGKVTTQPYWSLQVQLDEEKSYQDWQDELKPLLREAVHMRLMSDVPLGIFLSGGLDSSILTALMSEADSAPVKTFSIGFREKKYNETQYARLVAERYNTDHHELIVEPNIINLLPRLVAHYDEPYADASAMPTFLVSELTRQHVTVALSGEGGDELFGGYDRYFAMKVAGRVAGLPSALRKLLFGLPASLIPGSIEYKTRRTRLKKFLSGLSKDPKQSYFDWFQVFNDSQKQRIYHPDFLREVANDNPSSIYMNAFDRAGDVDAATAASFVDATCYLPNDLLVKTDIASMAYSLEGRSPFMDHKLIEFAFSMPMRHKMQGGIKKRILRDCFGHLLPAALLQRPKMGFGVPISAWFRNELKDSLQDILFDPVSLQRGWFEETQLRGFVQDHIEGRRDHGPHLWALLFAEMWMRHYIDGHGVSTS